jgi:uncharacterized lipoprotein
MQKFLILGLLAIVLLSGCDASATDQELIEDEQSPVVTVYKSPT